MPDKRQVSVHGAEITNQLGNRRVITIRLARVALDADTLVVALAADAHAVARMPRSIVRVNDAGHATGFSDVVCGRATFGVAQSVDNSFEHGMIARVVPPVDDDVVDAVRASASVVGTVIGGDVLIGHCFPFQKVSAYQTVMKSVRRLAALMMIV